MKPSLAVIAMLAATAAWGQQFEELGRRALDAAQAGRYQEAVSAYEQMLKIDPVNKGVRYDLALALNHLGRNRESLAALGKPADADALALAGLNHRALGDLASGFRLASAMLHNRPERCPVASVCFLGARANRLVDRDGREPSFESVLNVMYESGYRGDVYPAPWMWESAPKGVFPRFPFPASFRQMCDGGF